MNLFSKISSLVDSKSTGTRAKSRVSVSQSTGDVARITSLGFEALGLSPEIMRAISDEGYTHPTPIQRASIRELIAGRDLFGCAQTGTGKTAAFALPILEQLARKQRQGRPIRALVLTPTRELALQIDESFQAYGRHLPLRSTVVFGGVSPEGQRKRLQRGTDIVVATPGRLLDLYRQRCLDFSCLEILVLDEADRMLDMGFLPDVKRILKELPQNRQTVLFSATVPVDIQRLSSSILCDPVRVEVAPVSSTNENVEQSLYFVAKSQKRELLQHVLANDDLEKVLVFARTKAIANRLTKFLDTKHITAEAIHGNKSQAARQRALANFRSGATRVLVASDLASRGLDVEGITHVINFDLPNIAETYVHRIGRTGRATSRGQALSFCDNEERPYIKSIEKLIGMKIPVIRRHPFLAT